MHYFYAFLPFAITAMATETLTPTATAVVAATPTIDATLIASEASVASVASVSAVSVSSVAAFSAFAAALEREKESGRMITHLAHNVGEKETTLVTVTSTVTPGFSVATTGIPTKASSSRLLCTEKHSHCPEGMYCAIEPLRRRGVCIPRPPPAPICGGMEAKKCEGENVCVPNPVNGCKQMWTSGSCEGMCVRRDGKLAGGIA